MGVPKVGIFFVVDCHVLMDAVPMEQGEPYGNAMGHGGHYEFWDILAPRNGIEKRFKERAYDAYPRGRVLYFSRGKRFVLYADRCLKRSALQSLAERFGVAEPEFARDEHYQCATCNPLFID